MNLQKLLSPLKFLWEGTEAVAAVHSIGQMVSGEPKSTENKPLVSNPLGFGVKDELLTLLAYYDALDPITKAKALSEEDLIKVNRVIGRLTEAQQSKIVRIIGLREKTVEEGEPKKKETGGGKNQSKTVHITIEKIRSNPDGLHVIQLFASIINKDDPGLSVAKEKTIRAAIRDASFKLTEAKIEVTKAEHEKSIAEREVDWAELELSRNPNNSNKGRVRNRDSYRKEDADEKLKKAEISLATANLALEKAQYECEKTDNNLKEFEAAKTAVKIPRGLGKSGEEQLLDFLKNGIVSEPAKRIEQMMDGAAEVATHAMDILGVTEEKRDEICHNLRSQIANEDLKRLQKRCRRQGLPIPTALP
jgi:hypothetical protein